MLNFSQDIQIKKYLHIWKIPKYPFYISKKQCPSTKSVEFLIYKTMKQDNVWFHFEPTEKHPKDSKRACLGKPPVLLLRWPVGWDGLSTGHSTGDVAGCSCHCRGAPCGLSPAPQAPLPHAAQAFQGMSSLPTASCDLVFRTQCAFQLWVGWDMADLTLSTKMQVLA